MRLRSATIRNFRGIRHTRVDFDDLTVLLGENDSGKSSLLNALEACLGRAAPPDGFRFEPSDHHVPAGTDREGGPIEIELEMDAPFLRLEVHASSGEVRWRLGGQAGAPLAELRAALPMVRVRSGVLKPPSAPEGPANQVEQEIRSAWRRILEVAGEVPEEVNREAREALSRLVERAESWPIGAATGLPGGPGDPRRLATFLRGSGARALAVLAFTAAFLEARGPELAPGASPLVSVEDPEAHLHPIQTATVWSFIHGFKAQKVVTTNSPELLSAAPLTAVRRLVRDRRSDVAVHRMDPGVLTRDQERRIGYHVRARRGGLFFMRFWLLVEGETEFWFLPQVARACGFDLQQEGIDIVEFAQCGVEPLVRLAHALGIGWHLLADGDNAGHRYASEALDLLPAHPGGRVTRLVQRDLEHMLWESGYEAVYRREAGLPPAPRRRERPDAVIRDALDRTSKPRMALAVAEAMADPESPGVPGPLRAMVEDAVRRARLGGSG